MSFEEKYKQVNLEQKEAIDTIEGPVMVIAGPGTGKTQTLALRIANILKKTQIDPRNILCLTYTDNASLEMLNRLLSFIGSEAYKVKIYTFHSFCEYLISSNLEKFPQVSEKQRNIDETDRYEIVFSILKSLPIQDPFRNINNEGLYLRDIMNAISTLKREGVSPESFEELIVKEQDYLSKTCKIYENLKSLKPKQITSEVKSNFIDELLLNGGKDSIYTKGVLELSYEFPEGGTRFKSEVKKIFEQLSKDNYFPRLLSLKNIYNRYQNELSNRGAYDFEDMIMFVLERLVQDEDFLRNVQEEFQYILVDEYQDTNSAQNEIIEIIGSYYDNPNIFVVGDDDQSIFRFQGANLENILEFRDKYKEHLKVITLKNNYRSQANILSIADSIIQNAENRLEDSFDGVDKKLITNKTGVADKINVTKYKTNDSEILGVTEEIRSLLDKGVPPNEIAVIVTRNRDIEEYGSFFHKKGIPFHASKSGDVLEDTHIKNFITIINYLIDSTRSDLLGIMLYMPYFKLSTLDITRVLNYSNSKKLDLFQVISSTSILQEIGIQNPKELLEFVTDISVCQQQINLMHPSAFFPFILKKLNILSYLLDQPDNYLFLNDFNILYTFLKNHIAEDGKFTFEILLNKFELIKEFNLDILKRSEVIESDKIKILTVHKAKGLEFSYVFIPQLLSGNWEKPRANSGIKLPPSINKKDFVTNTQDERIRLFFVALTRAKENLYLSYPELSNENRENKPSWFLSLLDPTLINQHEEIIDEETHKNLLVTLLDEEPKTEFSGKGRKFLEDLLKDYALSPTDFNSYRKCPHCFFLTSIVRIPQVMSVSQVYGNSIHKSLNLFLSKFRRTLKLPGLEFLIDVFKTELKKQFVEDEDQYGEIEKKGCLALESFYKNKTSDIRATSLGELNFSSFRINIEGVPVVGRIDRIDFDEHNINNVTVVDYKTGIFNSSRVSVKGKGDYYTQLLFYKLLINNYPKYNWQVQSGKLVYLDTDSSGSIQNDKEFRLPEEDVKWLIDEIKATYNAIMNLDFDRKNEKDCYNKELHDINYHF